MLYPPGPVPPDNVRFDVDGLKIVPDPDIRIDLLYPQFMSLANDPRNAFYYARELSFHQEWEKCIDECKRYLALPGADWENERCYAYRVMARCYTEMGEWENAIKMARMSIIEAPNTRESWMEVAKITYHLNKWSECYSSCISAINIENREMVYTVDPEVWGSMPHDYASIAAWNL